MDYFLIDENTGLIRTRGLVGQDRTAVYNIRVRASDSGQPPKTNATDVEVVVNRNEAAPVFNPISYRKRIREDVKHSQTLETVTATDADLIGPSGTVRYELIGNSLAQQYFIVNSITGQVKIRESLAFEPQKRQTYTLRIGAYDLGTPRQNATVPATVIFDVDRNSHPPRFLNSPLNITIDENTARNTVIGRFQVRDDDTITDFRSVKFTALGDGPATTYFSVDGNGQIRVKNDIGNGRDNFYSFRVQAVDGGLLPLSDIGVAYITIRRNQYNPRFNSTSYQRTIPESQAVFTPFLRIHAYDLDRVHPHNALMFRISEVLQGPVLEYFSINPETGQIYLHNSLINDQNNVTPFRFRVHLSDKGTPVRNATSQATVTINVIHNRYPPQFFNSSMEVTINQTTPVNTEITRVVATDRDTFDLFRRIDYDVIGDDDGPAFFSVDRNSGRVRVKSSLLAANSDKLVYRVRVRARDGGQPRLEGIIVVTVNVIRNEHAPEFRQDTYPVTIKESLDVDGTVVRVNAFDRDSNVNNAIVYKMSHTYFYVDSDTGIVRIRKSLVGETRTQYIVSNHFTFICNYMESNKKHSCSQSFPYTHAPNIIFLFFYKIPLH